MAGGPPDDHPRRCQAQRRNGERCRRWALVGRSYCQFHGGRAKMGRKRGISRYGKHLGASLVGRLEELLEEPIADQVSLHEELALARTTVDAAIRLWDISQGKGKAELLAVGVMREALDFVRGMCESCARVDATAKDQVSMRVVNLLLLQVVRAVDRTVADKALVERVTRAIREGVRLPADSDADPGVEMTDFTPDRLVMEMDDTIGGRDVNESER